VVLMVSPIGNRYFRTETAAFPLLDNLIATC
jgi:hypothetical protein